MFCNGSIPFLLQKTLSSLSVSRASPFHRYARGHCASLLRVRLLPDRRLLAFVGDKPGVMRSRRGRPVRVFSFSGVVRHLLACVLALDRSAEIRAAAEHPSVSASNSRLGASFADSTGDQQEVFEDLPEGFHDDVDSITLAVGGHHTCALEYRPGVDFGGPVRCWGRDDWGQSTPSDDIFVQVRVVYRLRFWGKRKL